MWSTILPELMSIIVFILTILCLQAGKAPNYLQNYAILSLDTTGLKESYSHNNSNAVLPIHDVYTLYMITTCGGYYAKNSNPPLVNVTCSPPSTYSKFLPGNFITTDLYTDHSSATLATLSFPATIQDNFNERFNLQFHVAFVFYIMALIWVALAVLWGLVAFFKGSLGLYGASFTSSAATCLLIASVVVTVVQNQATALINNYGNAFGVSAYYGKGFIGLTWAAFAINLVSTAMWSCAAACSAAYRSSEV